MTSTPETSSGDLQLGLEAIAKEYDERGFAILRGVLDPDTIAAAHEHIAWIAAKYPDLRPEEYHHPLMRNDAFWVKLVADSRLVDIASYFLGPDVACFTSHYVCKPPHDGRPVLWHQDGSYWKLDPMEAITVWAAIDPSNTGNGCLRMIPGSHRLDIQKPVSRNDIPNMLHSQAREELIAEWTAKAGVEPVELEPGDVSIHHPNLLHFSPENSSPHRRCGLDIGYMPATTAISNEGLYLDPILLRGNPVPGVNRYRAFPMWSAAESIPFAGHQDWDAAAQELNQRYGLTEPDNSETPLETTYRMIDRLKEGTVK